MPFEQPAPRRTPAWPSLRDADDAFEGSIVPFSSARRRAARPAASSDDYRSDRAEPEPAWEPRRNRPRRRGAVRRTRSAPLAWYQQYGLGLAGAGLTAGLVGAAFLAVQLLHRGDSPAAAQSTTLAAPASSEGEVSSFVNLPAPPTAGDAGAASPTVGIRLAVRQLDPNYTVAQGDTLGAIATRFNTTAARIQAMNGINDPRSLSIGQKLVIPEPFTPGH
jgi:LysM repeat protein